MAIQDPTRQVVVIKVYEAVNDDMEGKPYGTGVYFSTAHAAAEYGKPGCLVPGGRLPKAHDALVFVDDGTVHLFGEAISVATSSDDVERQAALAKLTDHERKLLGL